MKILEYDNNVVKIQCNCGYASWYLSNIYVNQKCYRCNSNLLIIQNKVLKCNITHETCRSNDFILTKKTYIGDNLIFNKYLDLDNVAFIEYIFNITDLIIKNSKKNINYEDI